uniref:gustatory receptor 33b n=1 Tax=Aedes aegypti TaxID=7159 RepID=UPI000C1DC706|nr:gustatory receptor 33b [Aedes aegypti]
MSLLREPKSNSGWLNSRWFSVQNNVDSLNHIHVALKVFGIVAYTIVDRVNCEIIVSVSDLVLMAIFTVFRIYGIVIGVQNELWKTLVDGEPTAIAFGFASLMILVIIVNTITPIYVMIQRRRVQDILKDFKEYDDELGRLGYPRNHQYFHLRVAIFLTICLIALMAISAITLLLRDIEYETDEFIFLSFFGAACFGITLFHTSLNVLILGVHGRLQLLNRCLEEMLLEESELMSNKLHARTQRRDELLIHAAKLYDKLCDVSEAISVVFCGPLILQSINMFFVNLLSSYASMRVFLHQATPQQTINAGLYLSWSLYMVFFICQSILYLAALRQQKSTLLSIVHRSLNLPHNEFLIDRFHQLSEQITSREPHITFYFFELHPLIIVQVCGELATYLLILVQFDMQ